MSDIASTLKSAIAYGEAAVHAIRTNQDRAAYGASIAAAHYYREFERMIESQSLPSYYECPCGGWHPLEQAFSGDCRTDEFRFRYELDETYGIGGWIPVNED